LLAAHGETVFQYSRSSSELAGLSMAGRARAFAAGFWSPRTARELDALLERERPDVALVQNVFPLLSPSLYRALAGRVPIVQLVFNYRLLCPNAQLYTEGAICERCVPGNTTHAVIHRCYRRSRVYSAWYAAIVGLHRAAGTWHLIDRFVVPDRFLAAKLAEGGLPADRMRINTNPFDVGGFEPAPPGDYALFVGRFAPQKGVLTLVEAMARTRSGIRLVMVGDGEARPEVERRVDRLGLAGRVELTGAQWGDAVKRLIAGAMAVLVPSEWYDNAPLIVYQAYASAKPVIASRINGLIEVVADGTDGILFSPGDPEALAAAIDALAGDPERVRTMGAAARRRAEEEFSVGAHYRRLRAILDEVVRPTGP
jgi:glycosyltransferase involved in cell wall biosynthesis